MKRSIIAGARRDLLTKLLPRWVQATATTTMASSNEPASLEISAFDVKLEEKQQTFSNVPLGIDEEKGKKKKTPRRILHFSDGILEEYSTDEEEEKEPPPKAVDPKTLKWGAWFWYYMSTAACKSLGAADFMGEKLAWFFGITSPKYQYAIDEYEKMKAEEEEEKKRQEREAEAERQREADTLSGLEGGMESVFKSSQETDHNTPHGDTQALTGKQGIDNPALNLKY